MNHRRFLARPAALGARLAPVFLLLTFTPTWVANAQQNQIFDARTLAPFVPTPERVVDQMLEAAGVGKEDVVYDIGSGDGRILFAAAQKFSAKAVGVEINPFLAEETEKRAEQLGLSELVSVVQKDVFEVDLSDADVVTVYLLTSSNDKLKPKFEAELKPGARVVSHDFQFRGWKAEKTVDVASETARIHRVYVYRIGEHREE